MSKHRKQVQSVLSSAIILWFNVVRYCINNCKILIKCWTLKRHPIPHPGKLWGIVCGYLWGNWPCYNGTILYNAFYPATMVIKWPCHNINDTLKLKANVQFDWSLYPSWRFGLENNARAAPISQGHVPEEGNGVHPGPRQIGRCPLSDRHIKWVCIDKFVFYKNFITISSHFNTLSINIELLKCFADIFCQVCVYD